jgi:hypothetical protein
MPEEPDPVRAREEPKRLSRSQTALEERSRQMEFLDRVAVEAAKGEVSADEE